MGQLTIECFITLEELLEVLEFATEGTDPIFISENWNDLRVVSGSLNDELADPKFSRFYLGYEAVSSDLLKTSVNLWDAGFIQIDNPNRSKEYLGSVMVAFHTGLKETIAYQSTYLVFRKVVKEIKLRSTRGKHLICTRGNRIDRRYWLSEGARQWLLEGNNVTTSFHLERITSDPVVIHKLKS